MCVCVLCVFVCVKIYEYLFAKAHLILKTKCIYRISVGVSTAAIAAFDVWLYRSYSLTFPHEFRAKVSKAATYTEWLKWKYCNGDWCQAYYLEHI